MTSRGGVWADAQPSQPSPTSPADADAEMPKAVDDIPFDIHHASPEAEASSRPTASPTIVTQQSPTTVVDAPFHRSSSPKRLPEPTEATVPTDSPDGLDDERDETLGELDDRGGRIMPPPKRAKTAQQRDFGTMD
eukprot:4429438-Karenia_brevis.AAC.1